MKSRNFLAGALALAALAGCNQNKNGEQGTGTPVESNVTVTQANPPPGGDWTDVVNETNGGYLMGNPNAKVKVLEIASLGCPHCARFEQEGAPQLKEMVKTGNVSWEFRPYLIQGPVDMAANLIAKCNGAKSFFPIMEALYKDQQVWMGKLQSAPPERLEQLQSLPTNQLFVAIASLVGLQDWAAARGIPQAKSNQCLSNQAMIDKEVQVTTDVNAQYPEFRGTPSFAINGKLLPDTGNWQLLKPKVEEALK